MKNGLFLFLFLVPVFLLESFGILPSLFSTPITITITILFLRQIVLNHLNNPNSSTNFKSIFQLVLKTGLFFAFWFGLYYYVIINYVQTDLLESSIELVKQGQFFEIKNADEQYWNDVTKAIKSPITWVFYAFTINSFLFSALGLIFGLTFKTKADQ